MYFFDVGGIHLNLGLMVVDAHGAWLQDIRNYMAEAKYASWSILGDVAGDISKFRISEISALALQSLAIGFLMNLQGNYSNIVANVTKVLQWKIFSVWKVFYELPWHLALY